MKTPYLVEWSVVVGKQFFHSDSIRSHRFDVIWLIASAVEQAQLRYDIRITILWVAICP